ncbi:MAG: metal ABC transporter ATP-binding protein [Thaumarchaeota archaeon]|nr:metal ABC transporter ATP-binding protein [Nitrososphaerota archaeon]
MNGTVLQVQNLTISYGNHIAVDDISFDVQDGDLLGIVGPNGSGKTTTFRAILGLQPYGGKISMFGYGPDKFKSLIPLVGYVPQKIIFEPNFPATVHDIVSMGIIHEKKITKGMDLLKQNNCYLNRVQNTNGATTLDDTPNTVGPDCKNRTRSCTGCTTPDDALKTVDLEHLRDRRIGELSAGEQQRVFIAQSLIKNPLMMILDEPVTSADVESQTKFYSIMKKLSESGITIVWSSHDLDAIERYASRVACMNRKLFFHGKKEQFFSDEKLLKTYTESAMQVHMHRHGH